MVHVFADGQATVNGPDQDPVTPVFENVVARIDDRDLVLEIGNVAADVPFDEAQTVADEDWLRGQAEALYAARERGDYAEIPLTSADSKLRGFGGGMLTVVDDGKEHRILGPRRDFGPISHKGMLDISAGRTMYPASDESWLDLVVREGAEEIVFTRQDAESVLYLPVYGDASVKNLDRPAPAYGETALDETSQHAVLEQFIGAARDSNSHLHGQEFRVEPYDAEIVAPSDAARIVVEVAGEETVFDAGIGFEPETSSIEAFLYSVVAADELPQEYVPQDTEHMPGTHFDREVYEIGVETGDVTMYQGGTMTAATDVTGLQQRMDQEFVDNRSKESEDHYGTQYATVKVRNLLNPSSWPFGETVAVDSLQEPAVYGN